MPTPPRTNAAHDQNRIPTLLGVSTVDGATPVPVEVDPTTGQLQTSGGGGSATTLTNTRDANNEQTSPLAAGATFTGAYTKIDTYQSVQILYAATTPIASVTVVWSNDGVTPLSGSLGSSVIAQHVISGYNVAYQVWSGDIIAPYYKIVVVNGATIQTAYPGFISLNWLNNSPYNGSFMFLDENLTNVTKALITRSVIAGVTPHGDFKSIGLTAAEHLPVNPATSTVSVVADASGNNNHGTFTGLLPHAYPTNSPWTNFGAAMVFDGVDKGSFANNQVISCGITNFPATVFTVEAKAVKTRNATEVIAGKGSDGQVDVILFFGGNKLNAEIQDGVGAGISVTGATTVTNGKHDVACDWDGSNLRVYLDGVLDGTQAVTTKLAINSDPFTIGGDSSVTTHGRPFAGTIDEVRVSNIARYAGVSYTPATTEFSPDTNTTGLWHLDNVLGPSAVTAIEDEFNNFEAQNVTLSANTDTTITFVQPVRLIRIKNFDTSNKILIKNSAITSNTDAGADYVGVAPATNVPLSDYFPYRTSTIHVRSAGASLISVIGCY